MDSLICSSFTANIEIRPPHKSPILTTTAIIEVYKSNQFKELVLNRAVKPALVKQSLEARLNMEKPLSMLYEEKCGKKSSSNSMILSNFMFAQTHQGFSALLCGGNPCDSSFSNAHCWWRCGFRFFSEDRRHCLEWTGFWLRFNFERLYELEDRNNRWNYPNKILSYV